MTNCRHNNNTIIKTHKAIHHHSRLWTQESVIRCNKCGHVQTITESGDYQSRDSLRD